MGLLQLIKLLPALLHLILLLLGQFLVDCLELAVIVLHVLDFLLQRIDVDLELLLDGNVLADVGLVLLKLPLVFLVLEMGVQGTVVIVDVLGDRPPEDVVCGPAHRLLDRFLGPTQNPVGWRHLLRVVEPLDPGPLSAGLLLALCCEHQLLKRLLRQGSTDAVPNALLGLVFYQEFVLLSAETALDLVQHACTQGLVVSARDGASSSAVAHDQWPAFKDATNLR